MSFVQTTAVAGFQEQQSYCIEHSKQRQLFLPRRICGGGGVFPRAASLPRKNARLNAKSDGKTRRTTGLATGTAFGRRNLEEPIVERPVIIIITASNHQQQLSALRHLRRTSYEIIRYIEDYQLTVNHRRLHSMKTSDK